MQRAGYERLTLAGFTAAALLIVALVGATHWLTERESRAIAWVGHTYEVRAVIARARSDLLDLQNGQRGFVLTGDDRDLAVYLAAVDALEADVAALRGIVADNPGQARRAAALEGALVPRFAAAREIVQARRAAGVEAARTRVAADVPHEEMTAARALLAALDAEEERLLESRRSDEAAALGSFHALVTLLVVVVLLPLPLLYALVRRRRRQQDALLRSEQRFHLITQSVVDYAIFMLDSDGRVASWNVGAERIKGFRADEIIGEHFSRFYPPEDLAAGKPQMELRIADQEGRFEEEGWRVRKDGTRFWAGVVVTPLRNTAGARVGYAKVTRDLTERKLVEDAMLREVAERRRAEARLQEVNRSLESLVDERTAALRASNAELLAAQDGLRELSARLIGAQEEERRRIARELHDETGQSLAAIRLRLGDAAAGEPHSAERLRECVAIVDEAVAQIRNLAVNLRPPMLDDLGLADALGWMLERQAKSAGWRVRFDADELPERLDPEIATACFRIGQEALTNAARHAGASEVKVALRLGSRTLELAIADNGSGFQVDAYASAEERRKHFGLVSMSERAKLVGGRIEIDSQRGRGTRVHLILPLDPGGGDPQGTRARAAVT